MENLNQNENKEQDLSNAFNNPFGSGLIKKDAIDTILKNKELMEAISKIKL